MTEQRISISVCMSQELHDRAHAEATRRQMPQAALIRQALQAYLDKGQEDADEASGTVTMLKELIQKLDATADRVVVATFKIAEQAGMK